MSRRRYAITALALLIAAVWTTACDQQPSGVSDGEAGTLTTESRPTPTEPGAESLTPQVATATASPTPTLTSYVIPDVIPESPSFPCGPRGLDSEPYLYLAQLANVFMLNDPHLQWTPDGRHILFNGQDSAINIVDAEGTDVRTVVDMNPGYTPHYGLHLDVSPDGSRIVYSSCEYKTETLEEEWHSSERDRERSMYQYEIATIGIDGTSPKRLTENESLDHFPVWSPDGEYVAFISKPEEHEAGQLFIVPADGSEEATHLIVADNIEFVGYPLTWSPDGDYLTFFWFKSWTEGGIYTVKPDGSGLTRTGIEGIWALPEWSPSGEEFAFSKRDEDHPQPAIYSVRLDGTGMREIWSSGVEYRWELVPPRVTHLSWSPDGSEILFVLLSGYAPGSFHSEVYVVGVDGSGLRLLDSFDAFVLAEWSPVGSRIAIFDQARTPENAHSGGGLLITMSPDGGDVQPLAVAEEDSQYFGRRGGDGERFRPWNPPRPERPVDLSVCSSGVVVPEPELNPELVRDCETLLTIRDTLAGTGDLHSGGAGWSSQNPMNRWRGVKVDGSPLRVRELSLSGPGLTGSIPPEIGQLTGLKVLNLSGYSRYELFGLTGPIPPELDSLTDPKVLELRWSYLRGPIPRELGNLTELEYLDLGENYLTGSIPPELGALTKLKYIDVERNFLNGNIPPELGGLSSLTTLNLSYNWLRGEIPPELAGLESLEELWYDGNDFTGCISAELPKIWVERGPLKRCASDS